MPAVAKADAPFGTPTFPATLPPIQSWQNNPSFTNIGSGRISNGGCPQCRIDSCWQVMTAPGTSGMLGSSLTYQLCSVPVDQGEPDRSVILPGQKFNFLRDSKDNYVIQVAALNTNEMYCLELTRDLLVTVQPCRSGYGNQLFQFQEFGGISVSSNNPDVCISYAGGLYSDKIGFSSTCTNENFGRATGFPTVM